MYQLKTCEMFLRARDIEKVSTEFIKSNMLDHCPKAREHTLYFLTQQKFTGHKLTPNVAILFRSAFYQ